MGKFIKKTIFKYGNETMQQWETRVNEFFQQFSNEMEENKLDYDKDAKAAGLAMHNDNIYATYSYVLPDKEEESEKRKLGFK